MVLGPEDSKHGAVETHEEAKRCAALFQKNRDRIDGVIVSLPNFGDERAIADTLRMARLDVPVLVQATPDDAAKMTILHRRDSFCGKMSACNNLRQYGIPYSLTTAAYGKSGLGRISERSGMVRGRVPRGQRLAQSARRQHRRAPDGIQYRALQRKASRSAWASPPRRSISRKSSAASRKLKDDDAGVQGKLAEIRNTSPPAEFPMQRCQDGEARLRHR